MFAVVEIAGKQYKVTPNEQIEVDLLDQKEGDNVKFDKVLMVAESEDKAVLGHPYVKGASVEAKVVEHFKGEKVIVFKFIAKKRHSKTQGHRQNYTRLEITGIKA